MASIRKLKKEADYLISELIIDSLSYVSLHAKADKEKAFVIIQNALTLRNEVRDMVNHPDGKDDRKLVKAHYKAAIAKLVKGIETGYDELEKLALAS